MLKPKDGVLFHGPVIKQCLVDAGLVDIQSDYSSIPICWGGYVGKMIYEVGREERVLAEELTLFLLDNRLHLGKTRRAPMANARLRRRLR